jgi:hypothetical protein
LLSESEKAQKEAQNRLKAVDEKVALEKKAQLEQEKKVHELELKKIAQDKDLIGEANELTAKAKELEKVKQQNA